MEAVMEKISMTRCLPKSLQREQPRARLKLLQVLKQRSLSFLKGQKRCLVSYGLDIGFLNMCSDRTVQSVACLHL